jgi:hypothetical protein
MQVAAGVAASAAGLRQAPDAGDWLLVPERVISPAGPPLQTLRDCRASAARYIAARGLGRRAVPWPQYRALARNAADRNRS